MKLGIMQPYFFPYIGYFSLIAHTDQWVILDDVQFIRHGWIERNRVLNSSSEWQYIKVPLVKHSRETLIKDIQIRNSENWKEMILAQLTCYKRKAPYYHKVIDFLKESFLFNTESITHLNAHLLEKTCQYIGIKFNYSIFSESGIEIEEINDAGDWAFNIAKSLKANTYVNPINGQSLFDINKFRKANINLCFLKSNLKPYNQRIGKFEPGLSIIDVMMFNNQDEIIDILNDYQIVD
jgi:hypothetical protein